MSFVNQRGWRSPTSGRFYSKFCKACLGTPAREEVYVRVKRKIPSISLATVYKNIHLFIESGVFREVSLHHGSLRVETNSEPHYHLVCRRCKSIRDIGAKELGLVEKRSKCLEAFWRSATRWTFSACAPHARKRLDVVFISFQQEES